MSTLCKSIQYSLGMSLDQIRYFVAVAEEEHLTRASEKLKISQPPLTRQIRSLEVELGTPLFERVPKGMKLLPAGVVFLEHARLILEKVDDAFDALRVLKVPKEKKRKESVRFNSIE